MSATQPYDDLQLFVAIATGDESAFRKLFESYAPRIHPFVFGIVKQQEVADEIVQEVFLKVWLKRESLPAIEKPSSWIYRVASNLALTHYRRQQLEKKILTGMRGHEADNSNQEDFSVKELERLIHTAVGELSSRRQQIFKMSREQGLSRKEIAAQLNISENTVKNQLAISLKHVQDYIRAASGFYIPALLLLPYLL